MMPAGTIEEAVVVARSLGPAVEEALRLQAWALIHACAAVGPSAGEDHSPPRPAPRSQRTRRVSCLPETDFRRAGNAQRVAQQQAERDRRIAYALRLIVEVLSAGHPIRPSWTPAELGEFVWNRWLPEECGLGPEGKEPKQGTVRQYVYAVLDSGLLAPSLRRLIADPRGKIAQPSAAQA